MYSMRPSARIGCCRGCGRAAPGTCRGRSRSNSNCRSNSNRGHSVGGRGGAGCGGRRKYVPVGLAAACSCALSCAHGKTGVGRPAQPARGMPRAHGATVLQPHTARPRQFPMTDSRSTPCVDAERSDPLRLLIFSFFSVVDAHGNCPWPGGMGLRGCPRHGCRGQASTDGFTASPANPSRPATPRLLPSNAAHHEGLRRWRETYTGASAVNGAHGRLRSTA